MSLRMLFSQTRGSVCALAVAMLCACTGQVGSTSVEDDQSDGQGGTGGADVVVTPPAPWVPSQPFRRIGNDEWLYSAADLLSVDAAVLRAKVAETLPAEQVGDTTFQLPTGVDVDGVDRLLAAARLAVGEAPTLAGQCPDAARACIERAVLEVAGRAFRRPLRQEESDDLMALLDEAMALVGPAAAEDVRAAVLVAPAFLYHDEYQENDGEPASDGKPAPLSDLALAGRLASWLWRSVPDEELMSAARAGDLQDATKLAAQTRRMLADAKFGRTVWSFYSSLLDVEGLANEVRNVPAEDFSPAVAKQLEQELASFISGIILSGDGRLTTLLTSAEADLTPALAPRYGASPGKQTLDPQRRSGVLSLGAVVAAHATADEGSPIKRGRLVREKWLCDELPKMPANVPPLPPPMQMQSPRQRIEAHSSDPGCSGCHELMDPIGFAFSRFDAVGRYGDGAAIDSSGTVVDLDGQSQSFDDLPQLASLLASSAQVRSCAVRQWTRFLFARLEDGEADEAAVAELDKAFASSGTNIKELLYEIVMSPAFRLRAVDGEGGQP